MKYEIKKTGLDTFELVTGDLVIPFKRTIGIANKLDNIVAEARLNLAEFLKSKGKTKNDLIVEKKLGNGTTTYDETAYNELEKTFIEKEQLKTINSIIESAFGMDIVELVTKMGVDPNSTDTKVNNEMAIFGQKIMTVLVEAEKSPSNAPEEEL